MPDWREVLRKHMDLPEMTDHRDQRVLGEMADHLEDEYREALARGAAPEEAEEAARRWLGEQEDDVRKVLAAEGRPVAAQVRRASEEAEERLRARGGPWLPLADLLRDLRTAFRGLSRHPLFALVSVLVLALGIGSTTAIYTLVDAIVLSPLPFDGADRLVGLHHLAPEMGISDAGQCAAWHFTYLDESRSFEELGMYSTDQASVTGYGDPESVGTFEATEGVLKALRLTPALGRLFGPADMDPDGDATVMLSYGYWQSRFGGSPDAIGQTLRVDGSVREIIGVTPADFDGLGSSPSLIIPLRFRRSDLFVGNIGYGSVGRLAEGITKERAVAELNGILPHAWEKFPDGPIDSSNEVGAYSVEVRSLKDDLVGSVADILWILLGGVGIVLLIACANVANLFLVRAEGKGGEMAVRAALGAGQRRIGWEYMKEGIVLGLVGGIAGVVLAQVGLRTLMTLAPANLPRLQEVHLDASVLLFALVLSVGSGLFFGLVPMLRHRTAHLADTLKSGGRAGIGGRGGSRTQRVLAVGQTALALVLLVASGLMLRTFQSLRSLDPGFENPEELFTLALYIPSREIADVAEMAATHEAIAHRLEEIPGVSSVGLATQVPMAGGGNVNPLYVRDQKLAPDAPVVLRRHKWIGGGYLGTMGTSLLLGRSITWDDVHERAPVALLSERLARELFGSPEAALGQYVAARPTPPVWKEVVGVVADVREDGMSSDPPLLVYWPQVTLGFWDGSEAGAVQSWRTGWYVIRSARMGTPGFREELERAIWDVNPNLPLLNVGPLEDFMARSMADTSFTMVLLATAGVMALVLGLVGVYGVISYSVARRSRELGMRMALGAESGRVVRMVIRQGASLAGLGIGVGLVLAFATTRLMSAILFGVESADPATFGGVAAGLLLASLAASYLPARRAAKVDPVTALRTE